MSKQTDKAKALPTIWVVPDPLWKTIEAVLAVYDPPKTTGRTRIDARKAFDGIIFRLRTGCQWNQLPAGFGDDSSVHRTFQRWENLGIFDILWAILLTHCDELGGVDWQWQSADGCLGKARGVPKQAGDPDTPRAAKKGSPRTRRPQSHRPWQGRRPEKRACRRKRRAAFRRHQRREHARRQIACRPPRRGGRRGSATQPTGTTLKTPCVISSVGIRLFTRKFCPYNAF